MVIKDSALSLMLMKEPEAAIRAIVEDDNDALKYLSETVSYPETMPTRMCFRLDHKDQLAGYACFTNIRWYNRKAEVQVFLKKDVRGKRLGKQILDTLIRMAFDQFNLHRLEAEIISYNKAAVKLFENMGFKREGTLREAKYYGGRYHDILRYGLLKEEFEA